MKDLILWNNGFLDNLLGDIERDFWGNGMQKFQPKADVEESDKGYDFKLEVPGFNEKDLKVEVKNNVLSISGAINKKENKNENNFILRERSYCSFKRTFTLPKNVDTEKIDAKLLHGILNITLSKKEEEKPKLVTIK